MLFRLFIVHYYQNVLWTYIGISYCGFVTQTFLTRRDLERVKGFVIWFVCAELIPFPSLHEKQHWSWHYSAFYPAIILNSTGLCFNIHTLFQYLLSSNHISSLLNSLLWYGYFTRLLFRNSVIADSHSSASPIKANLLQSKLLICLQEAILVAHTICYKWTDTEWSGLLFCLLWGCKCQLVYMTCAQNSLSWYN